MKDFVMCRNFCLIFIMIFLVGMNFKNYCPLFGAVPTTVIAFDNHIHWSDDTIKKWEAKVMIPVEGWTVTTATESHHIDTTPLKGIGYKEQKRILEQVVQDNIDDAQDLVKKQEFISLKSKLNEIYDYLDRINIEKALSTQKENYHTRYYIIHLEKSLFSQHYFEVVAQPGEKKEVQIPVKGPIVQVYIFEDKQAEEFFKKYGVQRYLNSKYGHEHGLQKVVYDAVKKRKLAVETLFPEPSLSKKESFFDTGGEAGKSIPMTTFVGEDSSTLTKPLLAAGRE